MTGRVDELGRVAMIFTKKVKIEVTGPNIFLNVFLSKLPKTMFSVHVTSISTFCAFYSKMVYIDPSDNFAFCEILCSSNFFGQTSTKMMFSEVFPVRWLDNLKKKLVDTHHRKIH